MIVLRWEHTNSVQMTGTGTVVQTVVAKTFSRSQLRQSVQDRVLVRTRLMGGFLTTDSQSGPVAVPLVSVEANKWQRLCDIAE